jgi:hypothetical protein
LQSTGLVNGNPHLLWTRNSEKILANLYLIAISNDDYERISLYEQFAAASYCPNNYNSPQTPSKLVCAEDVCPEVQAADTSTVLEFSS